MVFWSRYGVSADSLRDSIASRTTRVLSSASTAALKKLRAICTKYPSVEEVVTFGNPGFKAGKKLFAALDLYKGKDCLWLRVDQERRDELLALEGWFASPYDPRQEAMCCELSRVDWKATPALLGRSYELARVPPKRRSGK